MPFIAAFLCTLLFFAGSFYPNPWSFAGAGVCGAALGALFASAQSREEGEWEYLESPSIEPLTLANLMDTAGSGLAPVYVSFGGLRAVSSAYVANVDGRRSIVVEWSQDAN